MLPTNVHTSICQAWKSRFTLVKSFPATHCNMELTWYQLTRDAGHFPDPCYLNPIFPRTDGVASLPTNPQHSWSKTEESCSRLHKSGSD